MSNFGKIMRAWLLPAALFGFFMASAPILTGCDEKPLAAVSADEGIARIRASHQSRSWERVIQQVNEYRSRYPYSRFAAEAELLQADAFFQSARFAEAATVYEEFLRKNPAAKEADLAAFRLAKSFESQSPGDADREQANTLRAIQRYNLFLEAHPESQYREEAKQQIQALRRLLAEHELFVANFYWKKSQYHAALNRYERILEEYKGDEDISQKARERAAKAYLELASQLEKNPESDKVVYFRNTTPAELRQKAQALQPR